MSENPPMVPVGTGAHPIMLVVIAANALRASSAFYAELFGWTLMPMSGELMVGTTSGGPTVALRANVPNGAPASVPFLGVTDVEATLARVVETGGSIDRAPWSMPMMGTMARFTDPSGTIYGLTSASSSAPVASMPPAASEWATR